MDIDDRNESIGKRIREAEKEWIRYILVIGEKETNSQNLSIRDRQTGNIRELSFDDFINEINKQKILVSRNLIEEFLIIFIVEFFVQ